MCVYRKVQIPLTPPGHNVSIKESENSNYYRWNVGLSLKNSKSPEMEVAVVNPRLQKYSIMYLLLFLQCHSVSTHQLCHHSQATQWTTTMLLTLAAFFPFLSLFLLFSIVPPLNCAFFCKWTGFVWTPPTSYFFHQIFIEQLLCIKHLSK